MQVSQALDCIYPPLHWWAQGPGGYLKGKRFPSPLHARPPRLVCAPEGDGGKRTFQSLPALLNTGENQDEMYTHFFLRWIVLKVNKTLLGVLRNKSHLVLI